MTFGIRRILAGGLAVLLVTMACSISVDLTPPPQPTSIPASTLVAQTLTALATLSTIPSAGDTLAQTQAASTSTLAFTSTPTLNFTPTLVSTSTPQPTTVTADALCYAGPGDSYEVVSAIQQDTQVKLIGKGALLGWLILQNPLYDDPCWIEQQFVHVDPSFDLSSLTVYSIPATPTPMLSFVVNYKFLNICISWDPVFSVTNTGGERFRSFDASVTDPKTGVNYEKIADDFAQPSGCSLGGSIPELLPGKTGWIYVHGFGYNLAGKKLDATVTLCTGLGATGACETDSFSFTAN